MYGWALVILASTDVLAASDPITLDPNSKLVAAASPGLQPPPGWRGGPLEGAPGGPRWRCPARGSFLRDLASLEFQKNSLIPGHASKRNLVVDRLNEK